MSGPVAWRRFETLDGASQALAEAVAVAIRSALDTRGEALVAVPGGTTPGAFLAALAGHALPWERVTLLPTDERFVAPDDPASNERMIRASFAPLREGRARFVSFHNAGDDLQAASARLDAVLARLPGLDVLVSGMGADGHIASLFPGESATARTEPGLHAVAAQPEGLPPRLSLSPARLVGAGWAALLIAGPAKEEVLRSAEAMPAAYPVGLLLERASGIEAYWAER